MLRIEKSIPPERVLKKHRCDDVQALKRLYTRTKVLISIVNMFRGYVAYCKANISIIVELFKVDTKRKRDDDCKFT